tara:strand:+ start:236 stop:604 length:369 start_codon:yes stop_codon:yes gene_type:complete
MKIYCQNCGKPTEYTALNKPNFCFNCGTPFAGGVSAANVNQVPQQTSSAALDNDQDEITEVPNINKLQVDINVQEVQAIKMENLAGTSQDGFSEPPRTVDGQSSEELINSFMKEASSLKRSD